MSQTETLAKQAERKNGKERLENHSLRREVAKIAILAILISRLNSQENDHLFTGQNGQELSTETPKAPSGEILALLAIAVVVSRHNKRETQETADGEAEDLTLEEEAALDDLRAYREGIYSSEPQDFMPAPSHSEEPLGPELPLLDDKDRVRPQGREPSQADIAAADRANEMYRYALWKQGWRGGATTEEQRKGARRDMITNSTAQDQAALTALNVMSAPAPTPGQSGPAEPSSNATSGAGGGEQAGAGSNSEV